MSSNIFVSYRVPVSKRYTIPVSFNGLDLSDAINKQMARLFQVLEVEGVINAHYEGDPWRTIPRNDIPGTQILVIDIEVDADHTRLWTKIEEVYNELKIDIRD